MKNLRVLIVDDSVDECRLISDALSSEGFSAEWTEDPLTALEWVAERPFDVVVTDLNMPRLNGNELCRRVSALTPHVPVVVVTAFGSIDSAVQAMRAGAYDFVTKPFDVDAVSLVLRRAAEHFALKREVDALRRAVDTSLKYGELYGTSLSMRAVYEFVDRVAPLDSPVLLTGEIGTGKELVARELHRRSSRAKGPFVLLSGLGLSDAALEIGLREADSGTLDLPELPPFLESARGGTLVLDEIADVPLNLQPKLLRTLDRYLLALRGLASACDVRVIATSSRDLETAIEEGRFREELYYRINVIHVELPPLRARGGDTLLLTQRFIDEIAVSTQSAVSGLTASCAERLLAYDWPGNVRELRNCVERAVALARSDRIDVEDLPRKIRDYHPQHVVVAGDDPSELVPLEDVERRYILRVLEACKGNKSQTAKVLGVSRKTLYRKLESYGVSVGLELDTRVEL